MPVNPFALTEGVPTDRVGERLVQARRGAGMNRWRASRITRISRSNLVRIERGRMRPPDGTVIALCRTYDVAVSWLVPERSGNEVRVGAGRIEVAGRARVLAGGDSDHAVEAVLGSYLAIVRELRGVAAGGVVSLRDEDLVALARSLGDTPSEIEARLVDLMKLSREEARAVGRELLKRRVAVPAAGLLLAAAAVTGALDGAGGRGAGVAGAGGGTFTGARAEHAVDQPATMTGDSGSFVTPAGRGAGGAQVAVPAPLGGGSVTATPDVSAGVDEVVIGDAVSLVRDAPPPAPRVVIALPAMPGTPAAGDDATDPATIGGSGGDSGTVDSGTVDSGTSGGTTPGSNTGGAAGENAHGGNDNANPNAADAGDNGAGDTSGESGATGNENAHGANPNADPDAANNANADNNARNSDTNAHGGNEHASANAADGASNGGAGNESADAASPSSNGNGASNAPSHP